MGNVYNSLTLSSHAAAAYAYAPAITPLIVTHHAEHTTMTRVAGGRQRPTPATLTIFATSRVQCRDRFDPRNYNYKPVPFCNQASKLPN